MCAKCILVFAICGMFVASNKPVLCLCVVCVRCENKNLKTWMLLAKTRILMMPCCGLKRETIFYEWNLSINEWKANKIYNIEEFSAIWKCTPLDSQRGRGGPQFWIYVIYFWKFVKRNTHIWLIRTGMSSYFSALCHRLTICCINAIHDMTEKNNF